MLTTIARAQTLRSPRSAASAGARRVAIESNVDLVFGRPRALGNVERQRANHREVADRLVEGHRHLDPDLVGDDLFALGIADEDGQWQRHGAGLTLRTQQDAAREAELDADATRLDLAFARRLGDLAAMHDGQTIADPALLVDGHVAFARPNLKPRTAVGHVEAGARTGTVGLRRRQHLVLADRADVGHGLALAEQAAADPRGER